MNRVSTQPIRFVKGSHIIQLYEDKEARITRRQELPESAFWNTEITRHTNVIVLSYAWLDKRHPDPDRFHLLQLGPLLKSFHNYQEKLKKESKNFRYEGDVAVFMDFMSLLQRPLQATRETWEHHLFRDSLKHMPLLYASGRSRVWCMTKVPASRRNRAYEHRGWCHFERSIASIATTGKKLLDMGRVSRIYEGMDFKSEVENTIMVFRSPPILPHEFHSDVQDKKFTAGHDRELVSKLYESTFDEMVNEVDRLEFAGLNWGYSETEKLAKLLRQCQKLERVILRGNQITEAGAQLIVEAIPKTVTFLDLRDNGLDFEFDDDPTEGEVRNSLMPEWKMEQRVQWEVDYFRALCARYKSTDRACFPDRQPPPANNAASKRRKPSVDGQQPSEDSTHSISYRMPNLGARKGQVSKDPTRCSAWKETPL